MNLSNPATCAVAIGFAVTGATFVGPLTLGVVAGGLLSGFAASRLEDVTGPLWRHTSQRYFDRGAELDPDLKRAYKTAFVAAVTQVEHSWFTTHPAGHHQRRQGKDGSAKALFRQLRTDAEQFLDGTWLDALDADAETLRQARAAGTSDIDIFDQSLAALLAYEDSQLRDYLPSALPPAIRACFEAELKHDDARGVAARRAYDLVVFDQLLANQSAMLRELSTQSAEHRDLIARWDDLITGVRSARDSLAMRMGKIGEDVGVLLGLVAQLSAQLHSSARVKPVSELAFGLGGDILVPLWAPGIHLGRDAEGNARRALDTHHAVILRGRPQSGKTHIAARLLLEHPDAVVIMPTEDHPRLAGQIPGDHLVILFLDDLHAYAETRSYEDWWSRIRDAFGDRARLIATSRAGSDWERIEDKREPFLRLIHQNSIVDTGAFGREEGGELWRLQGKDPRDFAARWDGTPGALVVDFPQMGRYYKQFQREVVEDVPTSRLLDAAKLLHSARQPVLHESLVRDVCEQVRGIRPMSDERWSRLKERTVQESFGAFDGDALSTYRPYLEREDIVSYVPSPEEFLRLHHVLMGRGVPEELFYFGVAADIDLSAKDLAEEAYRVAAEAGHAESANNLGLLLKARGRLDEAETLYRQAAEAGVAAAAHNLGLLLTERGWLDEAEAAYRQAVEAGDTAAAVNLGSMLHRRGRLDEAETLYRQAAEAGVAEAANNLGVLLEERGRLDEAEAAYRQAAGAGHAGAAYNLGSLLEERGRLDEAEAAWRQAAGAGLAAAAYNLGILLKERGRLDEAEAAYRQAAAAGHAGAANNLGVMLQERGWLDEAEAAWRQAAEAGHVGAAFNLGNLLTRSGNRAGAIRAYRKLLEDSSDDTCLEGITGLAELLLSSGKYTVGHRVLARGFALASQETNASLYIALRVLGYLHGSSSTRDTTLAELHQLVTQGSRIPTWEFSLGIARAQADRHPERTWLPILVDVVTDRKPVSALEEWQAWRDSSGDGKASQN